MTYHLRMAAAYFEATPEIYPHNWSATEFSESAMECWLQAMEALYPKD